MTDRRDLIGTVRDLLASERLVTLTGPGGAGKTWCARRAAEDLSRAFPDGAYVVELGDLADPALLPHTVAATLGLRVDGGHVDVPSLVPVLHDRQVLVVLDRCEHLLQDCARLAADLLRRCPAPRVLATSRQPLRVTGERVVVMPPLSVPDDPSSIDPATALTYDGVALFATRATAVLPDFRLTEENVEAVCAVCARLDGNPLAIELAAARSGLLAPQAILDRLDDRYRLLTKGGPDAPKQLRSLRASVDASWELCTDPERALWGRLSAFPADFDLDAVEEVCSGEGIEEAQVLDLVDSLLDKSVLRREVDPSAVRYRMPESLRAYGAQRLGEDGRRRWSDRHLSWTERLVRTAAEALAGPTQAGAFHRLERDHAHLRAALEAVTRDPARAPRALRMVLALEAWWVTAGRVTEARHWLTAALRHGTGTAEERARALALAAWFAACQGDLEEAGGLLEADSRIREVTAPATLGAITRARGALAVAAGSFDEAETFFSETVHLARRAGSAYTEAQGWLLLGLARHVAGRGPDAEEALRRCAAAADRAGDSQVRASAWGLRALGALARGDVWTARLLARDALRSKAEVGDWPAVAWLFDVLAWVALAEDDPARTATLLGAAERLWRGLAMAPDSVGPRVVGREERITAARDALGVREFERRVARGAALPLGAVVSYARGDDLPSERRPEPTAPLTSREMEVAELVARGMSNREIAAALVLSVRTVQGHVEKILRKLGFTSRAQVAAWVAQRRAEGAG